MTITMSETDQNEDPSGSFLTLESIDVNIYRASAKSLWRPVGSRFVFGGQVVGQALTAAFNTVQEPLLLHSLHCYFLRGGNNEKPIVYHVDRTRDGKTYTSRNIKATQDGVPIFSMQASFKIDETDPLEHQFTMPVVPNPEDLISSKEYMKNRLETEELTDIQRMRISEYLTQSIHIESRPVDPLVYHGQKQGEPRRYVWVRAMEHIGDNMQLQQCVAGFISDLALLGAARQPAPVGYQLGFVTSLDHSMWFHNPFRADEWMLYEIESPQCGKGKAFATGRMWRRDGTLAVSIAQEGVMRSKI
ncbi:acyl-coenzyme A thioesterase 8-like [Ostrea edulis]|uniref:acyl-coenzyme A thioesterase 8-like n=1 Tax=Ostrea edulis TaxID=37623 RepID=UPI002094F91A|nr:acyl-coenzyme A thioesterase 8-like [Ostrea edulis]